MLVIIQRSHPLRNSDEDGIELYYVQTCTVEVEKHTCTYSIGREYNMYELSL